MITCDDRSIQATFRGRKGRRAAEEEIAAKKRLQELEKKAVSIFSGNVTEGAFRQWVDFRDKVVALRKSSVRKMQHGSLLFCFDHWATKVDEAITVRQEAVLGCVQSLVDAAAQHDPHDALVTSLRGSGMPMEGIVDLAEMAQKLSQVRVCARHSHHSGERLLSCC